MNLNCKIAWKRVDVSVYLHLILHKNGLTMHIFIFCSCFCPIQVWSIEIGLHFVYIGILQSFNYFFSYFVRVGTLRPCIKYLCTVIFQGPFTSGNVSRIYTGLWTWLNIPFVSNFCGMKDEISAMHRPYVMVWYYALVFSTIWLPFWLQMKCLCSETIIVDKISARLVYKCLVCRP